MVVDRRKPLNHLLGFQMSIHVENQIDTKELEVELADITSKVSALRFPWIYWWGVFGLFIIPLVIQLNTYLSGPQKPEEYEKSGLYFFTFSFSALFYATLIVGGVFWYKKSKLEKKRHAILTTFLAKETKNLQDSLETNFVTNLVKINFKYIDKYYLQTQIQADKSFLLTSYAAIIGLFVIITGLIALFFDRTQSGYVATATGLLGEFIASVFFYLYNKTIAKMSDYHQKLVLTQNVSLALKIAEDLPEKEQCEAKLKLVDYLSKDVNQLIVKSNDS
jgi:hypothetical protein